MSLLVKPIKGKPIPKGYKTEYGTERDAFNFVRTISDITNRDPSEFAIIPKGRER